MTYKYMYQTPENFSNMIMNSDGEYLTGLWFEDSRDSFKLGTQRTALSDTVWQNRTGAAGYHEEDDGAGGLL